VSRQNSLTTQSMRIVLYPISTVLSSLVLQNYLTNYCRNFPHIIAVSFTY